MAATTRRDAGRALVLGLGRFGGGAAAARFLGSRGWRLRIADRARAEELQASRRALDKAASRQMQIEWRLGRSDLALLEAVDLLVVNPAVPDENPIYLEARRRGIPCTQEVNLFLESYPGQVVLVTGTHGKSSTATLLHRALLAGGLDSLLGGNIGRSLLADEASWRLEQVAVLEISSFQLERVDPRRHRVRGAVYTTVTADHLDRHGSLEAYHRAKARAAEMAQDFIVQPRDSGRIALPPTSTGRIVLYAEGPAAAGEVGLHQGWLESRLSVDPGPILHGAALGLLGDFQRPNALAAYAAAAALGVDRHAAALGLCLVRPLPHRLQVLAELAGICLLDNSVSTHVESTLSALVTLGTLASPETPSPRRRVHWVGGGLSKDGDYEAAAKALGPRCKSAHLFGAAARPLAGSMPRKLPVTCHEELEEALDAAWATAEAGDAVLFSPAFASYDQFPNFAARAARFETWARRLAADVRDEEG